MCVRMAGLFPQEVVSDVPRIALVGGTSLYVEQHHGLIAYQPEETVFRTGVGILRVAGSGLRFRLYSAAEAELVGEIDTVTLGREGGART